MREWLHQRLVTDGELMPDLPGGIKAAESFKDVPEDKPFAVHRFGLRRPEIRDGGETVAATQAVTVWVHDEPGDYLRIDDLLVRIRKRLESAPNGQGAGGAQLIKADWVDESHDLRDDEMGTICRYAVFNIAHAT